MYMVQRGFAYFEDNVELCLSTRVYVYNYKFIKSDSYLILGDRELGETTPVLWILFKITMCGNSWYLAILGPPNTATLKRVFKKSASLEESTI